MAFTSARDLATKFKYRTGLAAEKLSVLHAVWDKELGSLAKSCSLKAVSKGTLYVRPSSSAAAQEISMRKAEVIRSLNKYFQRKWIKGIRISP